MALLHLFSSTKCHVEDRAEAGGLREAFSSVVSVVFTHTCIHPQGYVECVINWSCPALHLQLKNLSFAEFSLWFYELGHLSVHCTLNNVIPQVIQDELTYWKHFGIINSPG